MTDDPEGVCGRCGRTHPKCKAHNRKGLPCGRPPCEGQRVCRFHGGASPQAKAKAVERIQRQRIAAELTSHGIALKEQHPIDGLLEEVYRSAAAVDCYGSLIAELDIPDPHDPMPGISGVGPDGDLVETTAMSQLYGADHLGDAAPHVLVNLWNAERTWHARCCKMALDAGVQERLVSVAESEGQQLVTVITGVLDDPDLGLTQEQRERGRIVAATLMRSVRRPAIATTAH